MMTMLMNWGQPLWGGVLIGVGAAGLMVTHGMIAGISGLMKNSILPKQGARGSSFCFLLGVLLAGWGYDFIFPPQAFGESPVAWHSVASAGLLVGVGSSLQNGCTSGHGVCGLGRFSPRSFVAVAVFSVVGALSLFASRLLLGGIS